MHRSVIHTFKTTTGTARNRLGEVVLEMEAIAKALTADEIQAAAAFQHDRCRSVRVVESDTYRPRASRWDLPRPATARRSRSASASWRSRRTQQNAVAKSEVGFCRLRAVGSIARGRALATTGGNGKTLACVQCHGPDLKGAGPVPGIAGRSPSYLARQLYDIKIGTRNGALAVLMKPVVATLTDRDVVDLVAFLSSLDPR